MKKKNQKVKNTTPTVINDITFKSKLEAYTYQKLIEANIEARYEEDRFTLLPSFEFQNKKIRAITYKPDFVGNNFIIECKGFATDAWHNREKLIKYYLLTNNLRYKYYIVHNHKEVDNAIKDIQNNESKSNQ